MTTTDEPKVEKQSASTEVIFPAMLYVKHEYAGTEDAYFHAADDCDDVTERTPRTIATYQLLHIQTLQLIATPVND